MNAPAIKGWCPGAHRPMMAGDGLIVRIRPNLARLHADQALGLCTLALRYGSGLIDLTNRSNLQIRGIVEADHDALLRELAALGLLDADPILESRRNVLVSPFWTEGDLTARLAAELSNRILELPPLPGKVGISVDTGPRRLLGEASADFRLERGEGGLILRADGTNRGRLVTEAGAIDALVEMAHWFNTNRSENRRRMVQVTAADPVPPEWACALPIPSTSPPPPGPHTSGALFGAPFGQIDATALAQLVAETGAPALRLTPWRLFLLEETDVPKQSCFVTAPDAPLMRADACPGTPYCPAATVQTRAVAAALVGHCDGSLHVSGCAKGCARKNPADVTLVGRNGRFDFVADGRPCDKPSKFRISPTEILEEIKYLP